MESISGVLVNYFLQKAFLLVKVHGRGADAVDCVSGHLSTWRGCQVSVSTIANGNKNH